MNVREKLNWKDTNLALFGSDLEKKIKAAAADSEPQWSNIGTSVALHIWRIEQFMVKPWPSNKHGKFHKGDSYVVLNTYKPEPSKPKLAHDIHIWIGDNRQEAVFPKKTLIMSFLNCRRVNTVYMFAYCAVYQCVDSSQDEYGTAAYKMVELDDKLGGTAVQHREVQGKESTLFQKYFGNHLTYLEGGVESGFHHVECSAAEPHLYKIKGTRKSDTLRLTQEPVRRNSLNTGDVFVLTAGEEAVWIWVGKESNQDEQAKGVEVAQAFCKKGNVIVLNQGVDDNEKEATEFWAFLPGKVAVLGPIKKSVRVQAADEKDNKSRAFVPVLFQIPEQTGGKLRKVATAKKQPVGPTRDMQYLLPRSTLQSKHGYLLDTGFHIFVWLGSQAPTICKANAMPQAHMYFSSFRRPLLPLTVVKERQETDLFQERFHEAGSAGCACVLM